MFTFKWIYCQSCHFQTLAVSALESLISFLIWQISKGDETEGKNFLLAINLCLIYFPTSKFRDEIYLSKQ